MDKITEGYRLSRSSLLPWTDLVILKHNPSVFDVRCKKKKILYILLVKADINYYKDE